MRKVIAMLLLGALLLCGCGEKAEETAEQTTVKGMVVSVDGTKVQLISTENMNMGSSPSRGEGDGQSEAGRPQGGNRPEGDFTMPEGDFTMPEGFEGGNMPNFGGQRPEGAEGDFTWPEGEFTMPEGFEGGNMPNFGGQRPEGAEGDFTMPEGFKGGSRFNTEDMETTTVDLADAHISVEIDGGKASGTMEDIKVGSQLTITLVDGKATRVIVSKSNGGGVGFGGGNRPDFGGDRGQRPGNRESQKSN